MIALISNVKRCLPEIDTALRDMSEASEYLQLSANINDLQEISLNLIKIIQDLKKFEKVVHRKYLINNINQ